MKCLWCGFQTTTNKTLATEEVRYANKEHIFPESVEGQKILELGKVCQLCNGRLGDFVDSNLKQGNLAMMRQYQESSAIKGKPIGKKRKKEKDQVRKEGEMRYLEDRSVRGKSIGRDGDTINLTNYLCIDDDGRPIDLDFDEKFAKALLKCALNVLYDQRSQEVMWKTYPHALGFVNKENYDDSQMWPYAACYSNIFSRLSFEPTCLATIDITNTEDSTQTTIALALLFPCAIFLVGLYPNALTWKLIQIFKKKLEASIESGLFNHFANSKKELDFFYLRRQINGMPDPMGSFHVLTRCHICHQINPTGIGIGKSLVLETSGGSLPHASHSWNFYTKEDLVTMGVNLEGMSDDEVDLFIRGVGVKTTEKFKSLQNITNFSRPCINCGEEMTFGSKDCFL
jgi:hypothetical protein